MQNATRFTLDGKKFSSFMSRVVHCGLLSAAVVTVAHFGNQFHDGTLAVPATPGLMEAHAATVVSAKSATPVKLAAYMPVSDEVALSEEMERVRDWVARRYRVSGDALEPVLYEAENQAREADLDPLLIVAMIAVESSFNPLAESHMGAQGLMQVIPRWHMDKIGEDADERALFDPRFNVQVGTLVLVEGLQRYGSLQAALQYYGGARNDPEARYSKRVLAMKQRLLAAARALKGA